MMLANAVMYNWCFGKHTGTLNDDNRLTSLLSCSSIVLSDACINPENASFSVSFSSVLFFALEAARHRKCYVKKQTHNTALANEC